MNTLLYQKTSCLNNRQVTYLPNAFPPQQNYLQKLPQDWQLLTQDFYTKPTLLVAEALLGKVLVRQTPCGAIVSVITETEAYHQLDPASHSYRGRKTARNQAMFGRAGYWYVYFTYGCHYCLNMVTEGEHVGAAVLIRSACPWWGLSAIENNRLGRKPWMIGPGRLTQALEIDLKLNQQSGFNQAAILRIYDSGFAPAKVITGPRIGIRQGLDYNWRWQVVDWEQSDVSCNTLI